MQIIRPLRLPLCGFNLALLLLLGHFRAAAQSAPADPGFIPTNPPAMQPIAAGTSTCRQRRFASR